MMELINGKQQKNKNKKLYLFINVKRINGNEYKRALHRRKKSGPKKEKTVSNEKSCEF